MARAWENSEACISSSIGRLQPMKTSDISKQICHARESKNISQWHFIHGKDAVWHHIYTASLRKKRKMKTVNFQKKVSQFSNYLILLSWPFFFLFTWHGLLLTLMLLRVLAEFYVVMIRWSLSTLSEVFFWIWVQYNQPVPDYRMAMSLMFISFDTSLGQEPLLTGGREGSSCTAHTSRP